MCIIFKSLGVFQNVNWRRSAKPSHCPGLQVTDFPIIPHGQCEQLHIRCEPLHNLHIRCEPIHNRFFLNPLVYFKNGTHKIFHLSFSCMHMRDIT